VTKAEGNQGQTTRFTFTVTLSATYDQAVTMSFGTANGTAKACLRIGFTGVDALVDD
jgi:hypothetical protein